MTVQIRLVKRLGLEVYTVVVDNVEVSQFLSANLAYNYISRKGLKLLGGAK